MTPFQKGVLEGFGFGVTLVCLIGIGITIFSGVIGLMVLVVRWMLVVVRGGCA